MKWMVNLNTIRQRVTLAANVGKILSTPWAIKTISFIFYRAMLAQSAVMRLHVVCLSVCPSVTIGYSVQIGLNSSKITSRPNSLRALGWLTPNMGDLVNGNTPKIRVE